MQHNSGVFHASPDQGMSGRTRNYYALSVRMLVGFYSKTPDKINENEIQNYSFLIYAHHQTPSLSIKEHFTDCQFKSQFVRMQASSDKLVKHY